MNSSQIKELFENFKNKKIAVVGDLMLDAYYWGNVKRISPEAPVPVVEIEKQFSRFGGAANVAFNIIKLEAYPIPIGVIGNDQTGIELKELMKRANITDEGIIIDSSRPTTAKTRVIADNQHVVRIDNESKENVQAEIESKIIEKFSNICGDLDAVILQDYNKGVLTKKVISEIIKIANANNVIITVDPKFDNFFEYKNVTVFKPNKKETEEAYGIRIESSEHFISAGSRLLNDLNAKYILLTLSEEGVALFGNGKLEKKIPTKAREVADVSGAGDTVISTLTVALAAGANISDAAYLANYAGGIVCEEVGIVPINKELLFEKLIKE